MRTIATAREFEQLGQFFNDFRFIQVAVDLLCWIVAEVIELAGGGIGCGLETAKTS